MPHSALIMFLFLAGAALLAFAALHDIGFRTVPNRVSVALLAVGVLLRLLQGDLPAGLGCGAAVFGITWLFWWKGWMGGADVKLLGSSAIVVAPSMVPTLVIGTSIAGGVLALVYVVGSRVLSSGVTARSPRSGSGLSLAGTALAGTSLGDPSFAPDAFAIPAFAAGMATARPSAASLSTASLSTASLSTASNSTAGVSFTGTPSSGASLVRRAARCELRRLRRSGPLPYAVAIAAGGWLAIAGS